MALVSTQPLALIVDGATSGAENMRRDADLLRRCADGEIAGALRLYWFSPPCMSIGRMQPTTDVDVERCRGDGIDVVRRPSGGRAVLHENEVTYALVCRVDDPDLGGDVARSCERVHLAVAPGLAILGVATRPRSTPDDARADAIASAGVADCFARPAAHELLDEHGRKLAGSAQARSGDALLQHGSVLLAPSRAAGFLQSNAGGSRPGPVRLERGSGGLRELSGREVTREETMLALAAGFSQILGDRLLDTTL